MHMIRLGESVKIGSLFGPILAGYILHIVLKCTNTHLIKICQLPGLVGAGVNFVYNGGIRKRGDLSWWVLVAVQVCV